MRFSEKLLTLRKERGLSQEELAEQLAVTRQAVSRWENGETLPDAPNLLKLADLFGVSVDGLLREGAAWSLAAEEEKTSPRKEENFGGDADAKSESVRKIPHLLCGFLWIISAGSFVVAGAISGEIYHVALALVNTIIACVHFFFYFRRSEAYRNFFWHTMGKEAKQHLTSALLFLFAALCFFFAGAVGGNLLFAVAGILELTASLAFFQRWHRSMGEEKM